MITVKQILKEFYVLPVPPGVLGDIEEDEVDIDNLIRQLDELKQDLNRRSWINLGLMLVIFLICIGVTLIYFKSPETIASLFSACGIGLGWTLIQINKWVKEIARINLIIVLCTSLNPDDINQIIKSLIQSEW
ncbi:MAG: hypothetical protein AAGA80_10035 [Cyanobacteria bacterium P01_F01_bin.143]